MYADALLEPWFRCLVEQVPTARVFDAHTHTGSDDPDGFRLSAAELKEGLALADARAVVFTTQEPAGYGPANDRVIGEAAASDGRLVAFCRLDPRDEPVAEAERCLAAGARGIKLHPRAERFAMDLPEVEAIFALADERRLPVIIHAGRGIPALGRHVMRLAERFANARPILAHAGISDLSWLWRHADGLPNLFYDTAWWNTVDLLTLFTHVPPGRILLGSDAPYGTPVGSVVLALRSALEAGLDEAQIQSVAGAQLERLLAGEEPRDAGPAPGPGAAAAVDLLLDRVHGFLNTAFGRIMVGDSGEESIALARLACEVGEDAPQAPVCRSVLALLDRYEDQLPEARARAEEHAGVGRHFPGTHLLLTAACVARTPRAPLPSEEIVASPAVGERTP